MSGKKYLTHNKISLDRAYQVIKAPVVTEKSTLAAQHSHFAFEIDAKATKYEVAKAVEMIFKVTVEGVNTQIRKGKVKRFRGRLGTRPNVKRAYVRLAQGQIIDVGAGL